MDEHEGANSVSAENPFFEVGDIKDEPGELTPTPLKRYVTFFEHRKEGNACKWICNFGCRSEPYTGTYSRIRAHLIGLLPGQKSQGVALCSKVHEEEREKMKNKEDEAKRIFGGCSRKKLVPSISVVSPICKTNRSMKIAKRQKSIPDMLRISHRDDVDGVIARFFYGNGIPLNVAKSPLWSDMVKAINEAPKGYEPPCVEKIKTTLLDQERTKVDQALISLKQQWPTYGVSIVSYGWTNLKNKLLVNVMAVSGGRTMFIRGIDCLGDEKSGEYIADFLLKAIETVGACNVVQVVTDSATACKTAGIIIQKRHPHIFWSGCMAHTLSLLIRDIINSMHPCLSFVGDCYRRAKGIMKYIKNHSSALCIFRTFSALNVIQVKKARFGHHFVVLDRIARVKNDLVSMVLSEEWEELKRGGLNMEHEEVRKTILDDDFWKNLKIILAFTKPIWGMIRFCDLDRAVIGEVYGRMEDMLGCIKVALLDNVEMYQAVQNIVMGRWEKMDFPLYTLAYVLTPYYYSESWLMSVAPGGEKRKKPHADPNVHKIYLDVVDQLVRDPREASLVRQQLSDFVSNRGVFTRPQAIKDRETMPAISWWDLYGVTAPELYSLAVKVLSQCVSTSCVERALSTYGYIHSVKRNKMNADRADTLLYVHYNHRLLTRYREDYEGTYKNWDSFVNDDNLENDMEAIEEREYGVLYADEIDAPRSPPSSITTISFPPPGFSNSLQAQKHEEIARAKRLRMG